MFFQNWNWRGVHQGLLDAALLLGEEQRSMLRTCS
jgi:hypothetical protein